MLRRRFYFDYAASTPVHPEVEKAMRPYFLKKFGNAGSLHSFGQEAVAALDQSRETIAAAIGADFREIIFTGSATEANNLALRGAIQHAMRMMRIPCGCRSIKENYSHHSHSSVDSHRLKIIVSSIEHESVLETARDAEKDGVEVVYLPVDQNGIVKLDELKSALDERTILVSVMYANNEIGTVQPIAEIAKIISIFRQAKNPCFPRTLAGGLARPARFLRGAASGKPPRTSERATGRAKRVEERQIFSRYPLFHTDAVQAFQFLDCDVSRLGVDLMTLSSHKIYGPKGIGALYVCRTSTTKLLESLVTGGGQEFGIRSGTENIPLIVGFAKAVELLFARSRESERERIAKLRGSFWRGLKKIYSRAERNGDAVKTAPHILNIYFPDYESQHLLTKFDLAGIAVSAGSACSVRSAAPSYVVQALGYSEKRAQQSIRFSFGRPTAQNDVDSALKIIRKLL